MITKFCLVHLLDQSIDEVLSVTSVTTLDEVEELSSSETTSWVGQLEWEQEVVDLLEVWTNSVNLVDQVLDGQDTVLTQVSLDNRVVRQSNSLLVDLTVTSLVDQLSDGRQVRVTISNVWLSQLQQLRSSLGNSDKNTSVDLVQSQQLQDLSWLWWDLVDTLDSDNKSQFWFSIDVVRTRCFSITLSLDDSTLSIDVLLLVGSSSVKDDLTFLLVGLNKLVMCFQMFFNIIDFFSPERWLTN